MSENHIEKTLKLIRGIPTIKLMARLQRGELLRDEAALAPFVIFFRHWKQGSAQVHAEAKV